MGCDGFGPTGLQVEARPSGPLVHGCRLTTAFDSRFTKGHRRHPGYRTTFWAARFNEYRVEYWDADRGLLGSLVGEREWFEPWSGDEGIRISQPDQPGVSRLSGVYLDAEGLLWVRLAYPSDRWADAFVNPSRVDGMGRPVPDGDLLWVRVLKVLDPREGTVVTRRRFEHALEFGGGNTFWRSWIDERGLPRVGIIPVHLEGRD